MPQPMAGGTEHLKFEMCPRKVFLQLSFHLNLFKQAHVLCFLYFLGEWNNSVLNHTVGFRNLSSMMDKPLAENLFQICLFLSGNKLEKAIVDC